MLALPIYLLSFIADIIFVFNIKKISIPNKKSRNIEEFFSKL